MADSNDGGGDVRIDGSFASGMYAHFVAFQQEHGNPDSTIAELTLTSGAMVYMIGFWISHLTNVPGVVMIRGRPDKSNDALVIREEEIYSVRFDAGDQKQDSPFGFAERTTS